MTQDEPRGQAATISPASGSEDGEGVVAQAQQQVQEKAAQARSQASTKLREQVDQRSHQASEQAQSLSDALRSSSRQLREQGQEGQANVIEQAAGRIEGLGSYLRNSDSDRILNDVESWVRRRPWAAAGIGALAGFVGSRFLKASSGRRYDAQRRNGLTRTPELSPPRQSVGYESVGYEARPGAL